MRFRYTFAAGCMLLCACTSHDVRSSYVHVADPKAAPQLLEGWHKVERGSWRWTEKRFAVSMRVPTPGRPATLKLRFAIPSANIDRLGSMTLFASVNGVTLPARPYNQPGDQLYSASVPADAMKGDAARIDFQLDKALPPDANDTRELGVIVSGVSLE